MRRFSVQVPEDLWEALQDLARRERQPLQPMLRDILQAVVDGDDPGRVVSAGTREAIDALREEQRRGGAALAEALIEGIKSLQEELAHVREEDRAERESLASALKGTQDGVDRILELHTPPLRDRATRGRKSLFRLGGGGT